MTKWGRRHSQVTVYAILLALRAKMRVFTSIRDNILSNGAITYWVWLEKKYQVEECYAVSIQPVQAVTTRHRKGPPSQKNGLCTIEYPKSVA